MEEKTEAKYFATYVKHITIQFSDIDGSHDPQKSVYFFPVRDRISEILLVDNLLVQHWKVTNYSESV